MTEGAISLLIVAADVGTAAFVVQGLAKQRPGWVVQVTCSLQGAMTACTAGDFDAIVAVPKPGTTWADKLFLEAGRQHPSCVRVLASGSLGATVPGASIVTPQRADAIIERLEPMLSARREKRTTVPPPAPASSEQMTG